jgi:hypothetical protein
MRPDPACGFWPRRSARGLKLAAREGLELIKELEGYPSLDDCPPHLQIRMANFYSTYIGPLAATEPGNHVQQEHHVDEIAETIRDRRRNRAIPRRHPTRPPDGSTRTSQSPRRRPAHASASS